MSIGQSARLVSYAWLSALRSGQSAFRTRLRGGYTLYKRKLPHPRWGRGSFRSFTPALRTGLLRRFLVTKSTLPSQLVSLGLDRRVASWRYGRLFCWLTQLWSQKWCRTAHGRDATAAPPASEFFDHDLENTFPEQPINKHLLELFADLLLALAGFVVADGLDLGLLRVTFFAQVCRFIWWFGVWATPDGISIGPIQCDRISLAWDALLSHMSFKVICLGILSNPSKNFILKTLDLGWLVLVEGRIVL